MLTASKVLIFLKFLQIESSPAPVKELHLQKNQDKKEFLVTEKNPD